MRCGEFVSLSAARQIGMHRSASIARSAEVEGFDHTLVYCIPAFYDASE